MATKSSTKKLLLTVSDRLYMSDILPQKGNYLELLTAKHISKKVEFSSAEVDELKLRQEGNQMRWNTKVENEKTVELTETELSFLSQRIDAMSEGNSLVFGAMDLYMKIKELDDAQKESINS